MKCLEAINPITVRDAIKSPSPAIGFFYQDSPIKAAAILSLLITDLVKFFNVGKTMDANQIAATIKLIFEDQEMRSLKPDDFKLCFTRMKKGHYGKSYDRIDGQIIFECLNSYLHERVLEWEQISFQEHKLIKEGLMAPANPEGQKRVLDILKEAVKGVKMNEPIKKDLSINGNKAVFKEADREIFIKKCFVEHYKTWLKSPAKDPVSGEILKGRFIMFEGKPVDEVEYTEIKLKQYDKENAI